MTSTDTTTENQAPAVRTVHHVSFRVDDLDEALGFYRQLLGCAELPRPDFGFPGAWLSAGGVQVHLMELPVDESTGSPPPKTNPMTNHVAFRVDDAAAFRSHLERNGFEVFAMAGMQTQCWVQDPSGNVIEFTSTAG